MIAKLREQDTTASQLMRTVASQYDYFWEIIGGQEEGLISSGIPDAMVCYKSKLLNGIQTAYNSTLSSSSDLLEQENIQIRNENLILRDTIYKINERLAVIESCLPSERVIVLREISREKAKDEIYKLFSSGETLYYSDIAQELGLDLELVVDICTELQKQGEITIDG